MREGEGSSGVWGLAIGRESRALQGHRAGLWGRGGGPESGPGV